ncbi:MAG: hypothetical protein NTW19_08940 [Planctomycetota bacterium]|nr:hypothetical protein [Planctomycetota bacterium]
MPLPRTGPRAAAFLLPLLLLVGCHAGPQSSAALGTGATSPSLSQGYALLYSTAGQDADVDKVLMLKSPEPRVAELVKSIAQFCGQVKAKLDGFAKEDASLDLKAEGLPALEVQTRDAIGSTTSKQILFGTGKEFEFRLLMTQHEALNYITHLLRVLAKAEANEARKMYLNQAAQTSAALHEKVLELMKGPYVGAGK